MEAAGECVYVAPPGAASFVLISVASSLPFVEAVENVWIPEGGGRE
jgi:hypothetical protein